MKLLKLLTISVLIALAFAPVRAQDNDSLRVQVPFPFVAGGQKFPAGEYIIEQTSQSGLIMLHSRSEGQTAAFLTMLVMTKSTEEPGAKFITVQGQKYLDRIELTDGTVRGVLVHSTK